MITTVKCLLLSCLAKVSHPCSDILYILLFIQMTNSNLSSMKLKQSNVKEVLSSQAVYIYQYLSALHSNLGIEIRHILHVALTRYIEYVCMHKRSYQHKCNKRPRGPVSLTCAYVEI